MGNISIAETEFFAYRIGVRPGNQHYFLWYHEARLANMQIHYYFGKFIPEFYNYFFQLKSFFIGVVYWYVDDVIFHSSSSLEEIFKHLFKTPFTYEVKRKKEN